MLITNGTCVSRIVKSSAGSRGSRRRHDSLRGMRRVGVRSVVVAMAPAEMGLYCETCDAMSWQFFTAESTDDRPAITAENCWVHWLPTSWNCGMPTYCTPGRPGRFVVPGLLIGAAAIESSVGA